MRVSVDYSRGELDILLVSQYIKQLTENIQRKESSRNVGHIRLNNEIYRNISNQLSLVIDRLDEVKYSIGNNSIFDKIYSEWKPIFLELKKFCEAEIPSRYCGAPLDERRTKFIEVQRQAFNRVHTLNREVVSFFESKAKFTDWRLELAASSKVFRDLSDIDAGSEELNKELNKEFKQRVLNEVVAGVYGSFREELYIWRNSNDREKLRSNCAGGSSIVSVILVSMALNVLLNTQNLETAILYTSVACGSFIFLNILAFISIKIGEFYYFKRKAFSEEEVNKVMMGVDVDEIAEQVEQELDAKTLIDQKLINNIKLILNGLDNGPERAMVV